MSRTGEELQGLIRGDVRFDDITRQLYSTDASIYQCRPLCVVFPHNTDDVAAAVRFASEHRIPVHLRGSGTGTRGDALGEGIVLDFTKYMRRIFYTGLDSVTAEPGILMRRLNGILAKTQARHIPSVTGNPHSTTVGSVLARNAAGLYYRRDGRIDTCVLELKTVLANGDVLHLNRQHLIDVAEEHESELNTGIQLAQEIAYGKEYTYCQRLSKILNERKIDLTRYFIGSRGTLGIIVEATLQTLPLPQRGSAYALFFESIKKAAAAVTQLNKSTAEFTPPPAPVLCELIDRRNLILIREQDERYKSLIPPDTGALLLVEFDTHNVDAAFAETLSPQYYQIKTDEHYALFDELIHRAPLVLQRLHSEVKPVPLIEDITVAVESLEEFVAGVMNVLQEHQITASLSGHIGQGQICITPLVDLSQPDILTKLRTFADAVRTLVTHYNTGVDTAIICNTNSTLYKKIKYLFDPHNVLGSIENGIEGGARGAGRKNRVSEPLFSPLPVSPLAKQLRWEPQRFAETVMRCNNCGECLRYDRKSRICPAFRGTSTQFYTPRSKAAFVRGILNNDLELNVLTDRAAYNLADSCLQCRMCDTECPSETDIAQAAFEIKSAYNSAHGLALDELVMSRLDTLLNVLTAVSCPVNALLRNRFVRWLLEKIIHVPRGQTIPPLAKIPFLRNVQLSRWFSRPRIEYFGTEKVALFVDTYTNFFDTKLAESAVRILEHNGISVEVPLHQKPAGVAAFAAGHKSLASALAHSNTALFADYIRQGYRIVTLNPAAASCITQDYRYFIEINDAAMLAENVTDFCTFIWRRHQEGKLLTNFKPLPCRIAYHAPCRSIALNRLRTDEPTPAELLLRLIPELDVQRLENGCCGGGGSYGFRQKHYKQSLQIGTPLCKALKEPDIDFGSSDCTLCCWQMTHGSRKPAKHPICLLAEAYE
ncbi:MAG: FAD-binding protein [Planctomycetaceae bacterium]|jgi:Fe-S oxidoreductase/FAD/FMN-containing dehydrogenase|nr:FAD-binding protein [Planctomycetaceae bacterium]